MGFTIPQLMLLKETVQGLSPTSIVKFFDGPPNDFSRVAGYCSYWEDVLGNWLNRCPDCGSQYDKEIGICKFLLTHPNDETVKIIHKDHKKFAGHSYIAVPYDGNLYQVEYDGPLRPTPFGLHTAGYQGPPDNIIPTDELEAIISQPDIDSAWDYYLSLGYDKSFKRDILKNTPAHYSKETGEIIINKPTKHRFISSPDHYSGASYFYLGAI